jgi:hypothetical protein
VPVSVTLVLIAIRLRFAWRVLVLSAASRDEARAA